MLSVIIITKDESPRLRLTLEALRHQVGAEAMEMVVVDDGSTDATPAVVEAAARVAPIVSLRNDEARGRSAARNAGARVAKGDRFLFLDGDVLASPSLVALHAAVPPDAMGRGETYHLRCTRFFLDPETGSPMPGQAERVAAMGAAFESSLVTMAQVKEDFAAIAARGEPGIYPGAGPRRLFELEWDALLAEPNLPVSWMAASGHNFSIPADAFHAEGGYATELTINEHRELALRLMQRGLCIAPVVGARSFHLTHRVGWRMDGDDWERVFLTKHPTPAAKLMSLFWQSLAKDPHIPEEARITSLHQLAAIVQSGSPHDYDAIRRRHPTLPTVD